MPPQISLGVLAGRDRFSGSVRPSFFLNRNQRTGSVAGLQFRLLIASIPKILTTSNDNGMARSLAADLILFQRVLERILSRSSWPSHVISVAAQRTQLS